MRLAHLITKLPDSDICIPDTTPDTSRVVTINELDVPDEDFCDIPRSKRIMSALDPNLTDRIPLIYIIHQDMVNLGERGWFALCRERSLLEDLMHWIIDLDFPHFTDLKRELILGRILD